jgi:hypothetical protein
MWESFRPFFEWNDHAMWGKAISGTVWMFPVIETIHILALTVMYGAMIMVDLRLLGLGMRRQPVNLLTRNLEPYMTWGVITMLVTGYFLFASEAMKCFANEGFKMKMEILFPAVIFQFTLFRWVTRQDDEKRPKLLGALVAVLSFALWVGVGVGGRAIGFV